MIQTLATCIGSPIKIDGNTFTAKRGRFARFCVEVKTNMPSELGIFICGKIYQVVYENLPCICHSCGRVGHTIRECNMTKHSNESTPQSDAVIASEQQIPITEEEEADLGSSWLLEKAKNKEFGEWMVMDRRKKKSNPISRNTGKAPMPQQRSNQSAQKQK